LRLGALKSKIKFGYKNFLLTLRRFFAIISLNLFQVFNAAVDVHPPVHRQEERFNSEEENNVF